MKNNSTSKSMLAKLIDQLIKEELDKALSLSNKRRKEFIEQFKLNEADLGGVKKDPKEDPLAFLGGDSPTETPKSPVGGAPTGATGTTGTNGTGSSAAPLDTNAGPNSDQTPPSGEASTAPEENSDPKNPIEDITSSAKELMKHTRDVPTILKLVKSKMQTNYSQLGDSSLEVIKALKDTKDPILASVAARLEQFFKAGK
jgi:hypothetical protein